MRNLWPPIEVIESNLIHGAVAPLHFPDREVVAADDQAGPTTVEMPAFLRDKIRKRVSSRKAQFDTQPKAGQIWRFDGEADKSAPLCVLLDQAQGEQRWQGWLASAETDYATDRDVLLEPRDEPFDPLAGMVQTWNPVSVDIRKGNRVLAQLSADRLDAIREVASGQCDASGGARPGFVAPIRTRSGATILAGTRITHPEDPRHRYQTLYRTAAQSLMQLQTPASAQVIPLQRKSRIWRQVGWSIAASVMLAQAAIIANLMRGQSEPDVTMNRISEYRSAPQPTAGYVFLEVYFKPDTKEVDIRKMLTRLNAAIVDGPGEFGQYRIRVTAGTEQQAMSALRGSGLVDGMDIRQ